MKQIRKALIKNGIVENIAVFDADNLPDWASAWVDAADEANIGYQFDGVTFAPKAPTAEERAAELAEWRSTAVLSRAQFCTRAFRAGLLPKDDAIAAAKGEWPPSFDAALAGLPENVKIEAQIEWAAVNEIRRNADTLVFVQVAEQIDDAQIDALFGWKET